MLNYNLTWTSGSTNSNTGVLPRAGLSAEKNNIMVFRPCDGEEHTLPMTHQDFRNGEELTDTTHLSCSSLWGTAPGCKNSQDQNQRYSQHPCRAACRQTDSKGSETRPRALPGGAVWATDGALSTSGLGSSSSPLLGYIFCAMMMRARRSEVVSVLALRLEWNENKW